MKAEGKLAGYFSANKKRLEMLGIRDADELIYAQEEAYRNMPSERFSDSFAAELLKQYWVEEKQILAV